MNTLLALLQRWAEVEPERCVTNSPHTGVPTSYPYVFRDGWARVLATDLRTLDILQGAVQVAIEARGWDWALGWMKYTGVFYGVCITGPTSEQRYNVNSQSSPAEALLEGYLEALVATGIAPHNAGSVSDPEKEKKA